MLRNTLGDRPWRDLSEDHVKPDTLSHLFRRLTHAGLWLPLFDASPRPTPPPRCAPWNTGCAASPAAPCGRRATPGGGMAETAHVNRLGLLTALPAVPWLPPIPDLSEPLFRRIDTVLSRLPAVRPAPGHLAQLRRALAIAGSRAVWSKRFMLS